jgi:hypothetical protein
MNGNGFICSLFYDAFSVTRLYGVDDMVISEEDEGEWIW